MKSLLRSTVINAAALLTLPYLFGGVRIEGGFQTAVIGGLVVTLLAWFVKPILSIISLPLNLLTFGAFSFLTQVILFYLLTIIIPQVQVRAFTFPGASYLGFVVPKIFFNTFFAYVVASFVFSFIVWFILWITKN